MSDSVALVAIFGFGFFFIIFVLLIIGIPLYRILVVKNEDNKNFDTRNPMITNQIPYYPMLWHYPKNYFINNVDEMYNKLKEKIDEYLKEIVDEKLNKDDKNYPKIVKTEDVTTEDSSLVVKKKNHIKDCKIEFIEFDTLENFNNQKNLKDFCGQHIFIKGTSEEFINHKEDENKDYGMYYFDNLCVLRFIFKPHPLIIGRN